MDDRITACNLSGDHASNKGAILNWGDTKNSVAFKDLL